MSYRQMVTYYASLATATRCVTDSSARSASVWGKSGALFVRGDNTGCKKRLDTVWNVRFVETDHYVHLCVYNVPLTFLPSLYPLCFKEKREREGERDREIKKRDRESERFKETDRE